MTLTEYLKPALAVIAVAVLGGGYYWFEHRSRAEDKEAPGQALVIVAKATNACFSDQVRGTGFVVPRREAVVGPDQEGSKVTDLYVREGDIVTDNQELARLSVTATAAGRAGSLQPGADLAARAGRGTRHRGQNDRRRTGLSTGRTDVSHCHQQ